MDEAKSVVDKAMSMCDDEDAIGAEALLLGYIASNPDNADLLTALGAVQSKLDKEEEAEATFRKVLTIDAQHEDATCALARILDQSLRNDEAEAVLRELLTSKPHSHCALDDLCRILVTEDRIDDALDIAEKHSKRFPKEIEAYSASRYVLARLEDKLRFDHEGPSDDPEIIEGLMKDLRMQFELILRMESEIGEDELRAAELYCDLHEEIVRLTGELEHLLPLASKVNTPSMNAALTAAKELIIIGEKRRANPPE